MNFNRHDFEMLFQYSLPNSLHTETLILSEKKRWCDCRKQVDTRETDRDDNPMYYCRNCTVWSNHFLLNVFTAFNGPQCSFLMPARLMVESTVLTCRGQLGALLFFFSFFFFYCGLTSR